MKRFLQIGALVCAFAVVCLGQTTTPNLGLQLPARGQLNWNTPVNANFSALDSLLGGTNAMPNGFWNAGRVAGTTLGLVLAPNCTATGSNYFPQSLNADGSWNCVQITSGGGDGSPYILPAASASTLGGVYSKDCSTAGTGYVLQKINTDGTETCVQVSAGSGAVNWGAIGGTLSAQTDLVAALAAKQAILGFSPLNPVNNLSELASASTARTNLGAASTGTCASGQYATGVGTTGPSCAQVAYGQLSGTPILGAGLVNNGGTFTTTGVTVTQVAFPLNSNALTANMVIFEMPVAMPFTFPTNGASGTCSSQLLFGTTPTATWVGIVNRIPSGGAAAQIGTVTVSTSGAQTWSVTATAFNPGDVYEVVAPSMVDTSAANPQLAACVVK